MKLLVTLALCISSVQGWPNKKGGEATTNKRLIGPGRGSSQPVEFKDYRDCEAVCGGDGLDVRGRWQHISTEDFGVDGRKLQLDPNGCYDISYGFQPQKSSTPEQDFFVDLPATGGSCIKITGTRKRGLGVAQVDGYVRLRANHVPNYPRNWETGVKGGIDGVPKQTIPKADLIKLNPLDVNYIMLSQNSAAEVWAINGDPTTFITTEDTSIAMIKPRRMPGDVGIGDVGVEGSSPYSLTCNNQDYDLSKSPEYGFLCKKSGPSPRNKHGWEL
jgi:hypothetical protein